MKQIGIEFSSNTIQQVNIYKQAANSESRTEGSQVKLTPTQKAAIQAICRENGIGVSTFLGRAIDAYLEIMPRIDKILRHKDLINTLIDTLQ